MLRSTAPPPHPLTRPPAQPISCVQGARLDVKWLLVVSHFGPSSHHLPPRSSMQGDRLDIKCLPAFEEVTKAGEGGNVRTMTAVRLQLVVEEV